MNKKIKYDKRYQEGDTPWELDRPDKNLIKVIKEQQIQPGKALDIGCGTASNAIWLARNGFDVTGADFSPLAIEKAKERTKQQGANIRLMVKDFLDGDVVGFDFEFVFDRGCFHGFAKEDQRKQFAKNVSRHLKEDGLWLSLLGNNDDEPRDEGPPMRSALEIIMAVEPFFELIFLKAGRFDSRLEKPARCWLSLMRKRNKT
ncbi:MAG: class I SAM-dependent methyltransferase [Desulfobacula sp.]|nr:class I SAM-dependent methyltransferase [Desulfobacula sp.]